MDKTRLLLALLLLGTLPGCFNRTNPITVNLIKSNACDDTAVDPMKDVTNMRVRFVNATKCGPPDATNNNAQSCQVDGGKTCTTDADCDYGKVVYEKIVDVASNSLPFDSIQTGTPLQIQITGFAGGAPPTGKAISFGQSTSFSVPVDKSDQATNVNVFFRPVEQFSPVVNSSDTTVCTALSTPRAGHSATVLDDGRVLIAGGFDTSGVTDAKNHPENWGFMSSVEIFDPATGITDNSAPVMNKSGVETPRAFHTATKTAGGGVLMFGGEYSSKKVMQDQTMTVIFDLSSGDMGGWLPQPLAVKRSRHASAVDKGGRVLFFGGLDWSTSPAPTFVQTFQWFDPAAGFFYVNADAAPLYAGDSMTAIEIHGGSYVGVIGGSTLDTGNTGKLNQDSGVRFYDFENSKMVQHSTTSLKVSRTFPAVAGSGTRYVISGGFTGFDPAKWWDLFPASPTNDTEVLDIANGKVQVVTGAALTNKRGHICAVTLNDGRMLFIGGRGGATAIGSVSDTAVFTNDTTKDDPISGITVADAGASPLAQPRYFHTCTLLQDGSVLVTGGINESGATFATLSSMEIWVPKPAD